MNTKQLLGAMALALTAGSTIAAPDMPDAALAPDLTRAEVIADLHLHQRAGLNQFDYDGANSNSDAYRRAKALYARLRGGPEYGEEVRRVATQRREVAAGVTIPAVAH